MTDPSPVERLDSLIDVATSGDGADEVIVGVEDLRAIRALIAGSIDGEDFDPSKGRAEECRHFSGISILGGDGPDYHPLSWKEAYEREQERRLQQQPLVNLLTDLTRCEHGRHEGDACSLSDGHCEGKVSLGNPVAGENRVIGYTMSGRPIRIPERGESWEVGR